MQSNKYIFRGFPEGLDYCIKRSTKENRRVVQHTGFGDAIIGMSNALGGEILTASLNPAHTQLQKLMLGKVKVNQDQKKWNHYVGQSYDNKTLAEVSGMIVSPGHVEKDYLKLNPTKFEPVLNIPTQYITVQTIGYSKKGRIDNIEKFEKFIKSFNLPFINLNDAERKYNLNQLAYVVDNARYHVSVDSGTAHFALCIKPRDDVVLCLNKNRLTGVGKKWIENQYNYEFI